jgi:hypothetical protein
MKRYFELDVNDGKGDICKNYFEAQVSVSLGWSGGEVRVR